MTLKAAVIGHPISHSKSPIIHGYWMKKYAIDGTYHAKDIFPENVEKEVSLLIKDGYSGFNVTIPYKEKILSLCSKIEKNAEIIGAVNTVTIEDGKLIGSNTDMFGFLQNVKENANQDCLKGKIVVLGAGGAARAVLTGLIQEGAQEIILINRTREKAEKLKKDFSSDINVVDWSQRSEVLKETTLLVNTTSLGMKGHETLDINLDLLPENAVVNDIVYAPLVTSLLAQAGKRGCKTVTGIGMLLHQARPAFEKWTGIMPDITDELQELVLA